MISSPKQADIPLLAVPADSLWFWEEGGGRWDGTSRATGPRSPPPARRMLSSWLGFLSSPPGELAPGRGTGTADGTGRKSPNPSSHSNTLPALTGGWGGQTH